METPHGDGQVCSRAFIDVRPLSAVLGEAHEVVIAAADHAIDSAEGCYPTIRAACRKAVIVAARAFGVGSTSPAIARSTTGAQSGPPPPRVADRQGRSRPTETDRGALVVDLYMAAAGG